MGRPYRPQGEGPGLSAGRGGALHGDVHLPSSWLVAPEGRALITEVADDLCVEFERAVVWPADRYPTVY
ncbi:hypothetical protein ABT115_00810 [Streptomyces sp. NPDC001832]|uniref:hypothetical protein n=1 Tax=Streptomyces sp. NPDC001832 TaxID=3154527 RepID=UPI003318519C